MSFNGPALSFDDEGSILFDGEKFIVNNPSKVPDNFDSGGRPVIGLPETHPASPNYRRPWLPSYIDPPVISTPPPVQQNPVQRPPATSRPQPPAKESQPWLPSYIDPPVTSTPPPVVVAPDISGAADKPGAQAAPPDIEEVGDDFGTDGLVDGISWDHPYRYRNLDVILVQQDIEMRPLTFQHCFAHSASRQDAMECIYAYPPDLDESELRHLQQFAEQKGSNMPAGMGGGGTDDEDGVGFSVPRRSLIRYEEHLESKYGFQIEWGDASDENIVAEQLNNLAQATSLIVNYLTEKVYGDESAALFAFRQFFGLSKFGRLVVNLGADGKLEKSTYGYVPPAYYNDERRLKNENLEELNQMYLGSAVDIATIVHEFGHVIDRSVQIVWQFEHNRDFWAPWRDETYVNMDLTIYHKSIEGLAAKQRATQEVWADTFMTAVLDPSNLKFGREYDVYSVKDAYVDDLPFSGLYNCTDDTCTRRVVRWRLDDEGNLEYFAGTVMDYMPDLLSGVMNPAKWRWIDELGLENL